MIARSDYNGRTWTKPVALTSGQKWHQAPSNVWYANGCVYLVMEQRVTQVIEHWYVGELAPVLMRAKIGDDLTKRESWTFAEAPQFNEAVDLTRVDLVGIPFYPYVPAAGVKLAPHRDMAPPGWLEANVVQFSDPGHFWYDPTGRTFHLWMRAHTGSMGYAAIAKVVEAGPKPGEGSMKLELETAPSGKTVVYVPLPGGQMRFHVVYDEREKLYWLLSTQATDSMRRPELLPDNRYSLADNERRRMQLHYSRNMMDWCFAGIVAVGEVEQASRHYATLVIEGEDLVILSRSGDAHAKTAHNGNLITFHRVPDFRDLADPWIKETINAAREVGDLKTEMLKTEKLKDGEAEN
ncbi:MAG: exo-alpha-sialidase [Opitutaceae bacterium]